MEWRSDCLIYLDNFNFNFSGVYERQFLKLSRKVRGSLVYSIYRTALQNIQQQTCWATLFNVVFYIVFNVSHLLSVCVKDTRDPWN